MKPPTRSVLITDLDNTLFDWVAIWHASFTAMLNEVVEKSGIGRDVLISDFREIHQKHGTSEYAFSLEELRSLKEKYPNDNLVTKFDSAIHKFRIARKQKLQLYPGVLETLQELKSRGSLIVGYTESMDFYTMFRMKRLNLDGLIDILYSPLDHDLPEGISVDQIRRLSSDAYSLLRTEHRHTPKGESKPNAKLLLKILFDLGASPDETVYVGDSLLKDVAMARDAGVLDVFAAYGEPRDRSEYELLRQVTHWKKEDVERERHIRADDVKPTITLHQCFNELLGVVKMRKWIAPLLHYDKDKIDNILEIWKKATDVQMHFNDIGIKIRNFALGIFSAFFGLMGVSLHQKLRIVLAGIDMPIALPISLLTLVVLVAFFIMDKYWYHKLLIGAVQRGQHIEQRLRLVLPESRLAGDIGDASPVNIFKWHLHSDHKLIIFYGIIAVVLIAVSVVFGFDVHFVVGGDGR